MTNTALHPPALAQEAEKVTLALRELTLATGRLLAALWRTLPHRQPPCQVKTARQGPDTLRADTDRLYRTDPRFAQDLYAAANRHELAAAATSSLDACLAGTGCGARARIPFMSRQAGDPRH